MPFLGLTSSYLVNIQPKSKFHHPHQNFPDPTLAVDDTASDLTDQEIESSPSRVSCSYVRDMHTAHIRNSQSFV